MLLLIVIINIRQNSLYSILDIELGYEGLQDDDIHPFVAKSGKLLLRQKYLNQDFDMQKGELEVKEEPLKRDLYAENKLII